MVTAVSPNQPHVPSAPPGPSPRAGDHPGATPEQVWQSWPGWADVPAAELPGPGARVVVLAAHPDDEVLGVGGLLVRLAARGCDLLLVSATDGEASHPESPTVTSAELAERRLHEQDAALTELGHAGSERVHLHLPDSALSAHEGELADRLESLLGGAVLLLAPWRDDGHPDHAACGRAAAAATEGLARVGAAVGVAAPVPVLWEFPVWAWHWATPDAGDIPWDRARTVRLDPHERVAKQQAIDCFGSQLHPLGDDPSDAAVLPPDVLAHFERDLEVVLT